MTDSARQPGMFLELAVDIDAVERARLALLDYLHPFGLSESAINRIEVVLEELLSNVVRHSDNVRMFTFEALWHEGLLRLTVRDDGPAFNPLEAAPPRRFASVEDAQLGGLGIGLIRKLSQDLSYDRTGGVNRISALLAA